MSGFIEAVTGLSLRAPTLCWLGLLVPIALLWRLRSGEVALRLAPGVLLEGRGSPPLPRSWRERLLPLPRALDVAGLLLVVVVLARPTERVALPQTSEGIDVLLCLDVSSSMKAKDLHPERSRLEIAKAAAADFARGRANDRIGLLRFARYPDLSCPPTLDHRALETFLDELDLVDAESFEDRTGVGSAVARAAKLLRGSVAPSKVVILLTDGEENVATADSPAEIGPLTAAWLCNQLGVRVYTVVAGIGKRNKEGDFVPLDTSRVRELAERTGGAFFEAKDAGALAKVYERIDELERVELSRPRYVQRDAYATLLCLAIALVVAGRLLAATVFEVLP